MTRRGPAAASAGASTSKSATVRVRPGRQTTGRVAERRGPYSRTCSRKPSGALIKTLDPSSAEAAACYAEALRADPGNADAHCYLGMIACQHGRFAEGAERARQALSHDPRNARAHMLLGRALAALGQP